MMVKLFILDLMILDFSRDSPLASYKLASYKLQVSSTFIFNLSNYPL